jgi:hypothetical protein
MDVNYPEELTEDARGKLEDAAARIESLTIEDREYALERSSFPEDAVVLEDRDGLPYVVDGEKPFAGDAVVAMDGNDARIAVEWNSRRGHWKEDDYAGMVYDAMEEAGIDRPRGNPRVGVQFGGHGNIAIENVIEDAGGGL